MKPWKFCISTADEAPKTAPIMLCGDVCDNLKQAAALGFDAIEVHTRETARLDYDRIHRTIVRMLPMPPSAACCAMWTWPKKCRPA